jgi:hypothetical protein
MRELLSVVLFFALAGSMQGQDHSQWRTQSGPTGGKAIDLVTVSDPSLRHKCRVHSITEAEVVCGVGPLRKPVIYQRENVAALILPPTHSALVSSILEVAVSAGLIAGSLFVPITAVAVMMQVYGGFSASGIIANLICHNNDHDHDIVAYQRANTALNITLR